MQTRRIWFVQPPRAVSLALIYGALLLLCTVSLIGLLFAYWPEDATNAVSSPGGSESSPAGQAFEGVLRVTPEAPRPPDRRVWA